jgi:hypothetical protein
MMTTFTHPSRFMLNLVAASLLSAFGSSYAQDPVPGAAAGKPPVAAPNPGELKPFKDVLKDSSESKGFFTVHRKDDKVWLEIRPEQLDKPFFFSVNTTNGMGERRLYASQMGTHHVAYFHRIGNQIQLLAKNTEFTAQPNTPQAIAVGQAFSDSLLGSAAVVSAAHPDSKAFLVDANALLLTDIPGYATLLDFAFRQPYAFDPRNSSFGKIRADEHLTGIPVSAHFALPRIAAPSLVPSPVPLPGLPNALPDPRSMFLGFYYNFAALPATPMAVREADDRIGYFVSTQHDFTDDLTPKTGRHLVHRWRLEKKDPAAALSEPVKPITYWLDKNIPLKYRKAITEGILEWNLAFEKIGFKNAVVAKQQQDNDEFDTLDANHASIRWFLGADVGFAIGPSHVDERSGEILDADIGMSEVFARGARRFVGEDGSMPLANPLNQKSNQALCSYGLEAPNEFNFALDLLEARGEFDMDSPKAEALAQAYVKDVIMHEVGHTLGLRHNFRSSTIYSLKQIADPEFTKKHGLTGSVMDYNPFNIAVKGEAQGEYVMSTLGPYDYWAIEYAYKPIDPAQEKAELAKIAARSTEPQLAYGTDEDAGGYLSDPEVNVFDLGSDPLVYTKKRLANSRELWDRLQAKKLKPGESYDTLRRSFEYGFNQFSRAIPPTAKFIGGVSFVRDHAGSGKVPFTPVAAERQREALSLITGSLFKPDSFKFSPDLVSRLGPDHFEERRQIRDVSIADHVLALQNGVLNQLFSDGVAHRLLDSQEKVADSKKVLSLAELYDGLQASIWSELKGGKDISSMRRNLQREHLKRIANTLVRPAPSTPADARSLLRENAVQLQKEIAAALAKPMSKEAKAHLAESLNSISEALKAPLARTGV